LNIITVAAAPGVTNTAICKGDTGILPTATALPGYSLLWYSSATASVPLSWVPVVSSVTKTYYVAQKLGVSISPKAAVTVTVNPLPTTPSALVLTSGTEVIKKVGNFIRTQTPLTLTATPAETVVTHHYNWTLPADVNQTEGGSTGSITINFNGLVLGNTAIDLLVTSVSAEGCVSKTAKKLTVARSEPAKPKALILTDSELPNIPKITKIDAYTGALKGRTLTLTATPETKAGLQASSYKWVLPSAVSTTAIPFVENSVVVPNTYISTNPSIKVTLGGFTNETLYLFKVYGVNGNGTSLLSKDLTCTSAAPNTPGAITTPSLNKPTYNATCLCHYSSSPSGSWSKLCLVSWSRSFDC
jgi:hypothetical protein